MIEWHWLLVAFIGGIGACITFFVCLMLFLDWKQNRNLTAATRRIRENARRAELEAADHRQYQRMIDAERLNLENFLIEPDDLVFEPEPEFNLNDVLDDLDLQLAHHPDIGDVTMRTAAEQEFFNERAGWRWHSRDICRRTRTRALAENIALNHCVIHNPSDHNMRTWPMHLRETNLIERLCPHGIGHPDPDSARAMDFITWNRVDHPYGYDQHGCDGCCKKPGVETLDVVWN